MKCKRCRCEAEYLDSDGNHLVRLGCIFALKARVAELASKLARLIDATEDAIINLDNIYPTEMSESREYKAMVETLEEIKRKEEKP